MQNNWKWLGVLFIGLACSTHCLAADTLRILAHKRSGGATTLDGKDKLDGKDNPLSFEVGLFHISIPFRFVKEIRFGKGAEHQVTTQSGRVLAARSLKGAFAEKWRLEDESIDWSVFERIEIQVEGNSKAEKPSAQGSPDPEVEIVDQHNMQLANIAPDNTVAVFIPGRFHLVADMRTLRGFTTQGVGATRPSLVLEGSHKQKLTATPSAPDFFGTLAGGGTVEIAWADIKSIVLTRSSAEQLPVPTGVKVTLKASEGQSIEPAFISTDSRVLLNWKGFTLDVHQHDLIALERVVSGEGSREQFQLTLRGAATIFPVTPEVSEQCVQTLFGRACIYWEEIESFRTSQNPPNANAVPEPPRRKRFSVATLSGAELNTTELQYAERWFIAPDGFLEFSLRAGELVGLRRDQNAVRIETASGHKLVGAIPTSAIVKGPLFQEGGSRSEFRVLVDQVAVVSADTKPTNPKQEPSHVAFVVTDANGATHLIAEPKLVQERKICSSCMCMGGACGFSDARPDGIPMGERNDDKARQEIKWSQLQGLTRGDDGAVTCNLADGSQGIGFLKFGSTKYCECEGVTRLHAATAWGSLRLPVDKIKSIAAHRETR